MTSVQFTIRRKVLTLFGAKFHIYNSDGSLLGFCKQKAFKLKEDIRLYADQTMAHERLVITARNIIDFSAAYDVVDSRQQRKVGALRRKGVASLFRDTWKVLDEADREIGSISEDTPLLALVRRFAAKWLPQTFHLTDGTGRQLAEFRSHFNPFVQKMTVTLLPECQLDPMLVLAAGVLLVAIEGRQR